MSTVQEFIEPAELDRNTIEFLQGKTEDLPVSATPGTFYVTFDDATLESTAQAKLYIGGLRNELHQLSRPIWKKYSSNT